MGRPTFQVGDRVICGLSRYSARLPGIVVRLAGRGGGMTAAVRLDRGEVRICECRWLEWVGRGEGEDDEKKEGG